MVEGSQTRRAFQDARAFTRGHIKRSACLHQTERAVNERGERPMPRNVAPHERTAAAEKNAYQ